MHRLRRALIVAFTPAFAIVGTLAAVTQPASAQGAPFTSTSTIANDNLRTSWYPDQTTLTPSAVANPAFGQVWNATLDPPNDGYAGPDQVYGQPQVWVNPNVPDGRTGHAVAVIGTEANHVYGYDATTGARLYNVPMGLPFGPTNIDGAGTACNDLTPRIGVTGTPVIDASGVAYVAYKTIRNGPAEYYMRAFRADTGVTLWETKVAGNADNVSGVSFNAQTELQRPGLLLLDGHVYAAFGAHCDKGIFQGWVVGFDAATGGISTMFSTAPSWTAGGDSIAAAGIWQAGGGLVSDGPGRILLATGNAEGNTGLPANQAPLSGAGAGYPSSQYALTQAVARLDVQPDGKLTLGSFFVPSNAFGLDTCDLDVGSGGPVAIPDAALPSALRGNVKALVQVGKMGVIRVLDRDNLGGFAGAGNTDNVLSQVDTQTTPTDLNCPPGAKLKGAGVWSSPAVWPGPAGGDGGYVYITSALAGNVCSGTGTIGCVTAYRITNVSGKPTLVKAGTTVDAFAFGSGSPVITSIGTQPGTGVLWDIYMAGGDGSASALKAYNPIPDGGGRLTLIKSFALGVASKFSRPVASGNHLFVATRDGHLISFGLPQAAQTSTTALAFGTVAVGSQQTQDAVVTNTGPSPITVTGLTPPVGPWSTTVAPGTVIPAGGSIAVPITLAPVTGGSWSGPFDIDTTGGFVSIAVSGNAPSGAGAPFEALPPARVLDTRLTGGPLHGGETRLVRMTGVGGVPESGVGAVVVNVTATNTSAPGYLTVFPAGEAPPTASNLNFVAGETIANLVTVKVGVDGSVGLFNFMGSTDAVFDVVGWYPASSDAAVRVGGAAASAGQLVGLAPARVLDTRLTGQTLDSGGSLDLPVAGVGGVPVSGASAVVVNVTATNTSAPGYLTVWPSGLARPTASNLNFVAGQSVPNLAIAKLGAGGRISVFNFSGRTDVVVDVMGYFTDGTTDPGTEGSLFHPLAPSRILDTRISQQTLMNGASLRLGVEGVGGLPPTGVKAVAVNVTATNTSAAGYLTVWPTGVAPPTASNLNFVAGQTVPNMVIARAGGDGSVSIFNFGGRTDVVADVVGWYG